MFLGISDDIVKKDGDFMMRIGGINSPLEATRFGETPKIQKKAVEASKNAMTDSYIEQLKEYARKDAQKGIYMDKEAIQFQRGQMSQCVSTDRSGMTQANQVLQELGRKEDEDALLKFLDRMLGITAKARKSSDKQTFVTMSGMAGNCSGKIHHNSTGQTAEIYSSDGEMIASYNSNGDGWTIEQTKAESKFLQESAMIYKQAFDAARAEIKNAAQKPTVCEEETATFDVRA